MASISENNLEISNLLASTSNGMPVCNDLGVALTGSLASGEYNWWLVLLSYVIATFAAYSALSVTHQVRQTKNFTASLWKIGGAFTLGSGIWSMHFVGMLAFKMPMAVSYDLPLTLVSLFVAIIAAWYALSHLGREDEALGHRMMASIVMGSGISTMHYLGMQAMQMDAIIQYNKVLVALSVIIAIAAAFVAIVLAHYFSADTKRGNRQLKILSALMMGIAIAGMHYTGTSAASFYHANKLNESVLPIDSNLMAFSITFVMIMIIGVMILAASLQRSASSRLRVGFLILTMSTVSLLIALVVVNMLYRVSIEQQEARLLDMVKKQSNIISYIIKKNENNTPEAQENILNQISAALNHGEDSVNAKLTLVIKNGSLIQIINTTTNKDKETQVLPFNLRQAEPMRRGLLGESGTGIYSDYIDNSKQILSAYSSIEKYKLAILASVELDELKSPYIEAMLKSATFGVLVIIFGSGLFLGITNPIIKKLQEEISKRAIVETELRKSRDELELRVKERTQELLNANKELDVALEIAKDASKSKSDFLANMSHEIRTPMNGVLGMLHLLSGSSLTKEQAEYVSTAEKSAENLLILINDILDISKIEAGKLAFENTEFNLHEEVADIGVLLAENAHRKGLELAIDIAENVPIMVKGDSTRLRQILFNLMGNAIKFTEKGEVVLSVQCQESNAEHNLLRFSVKDTGIGVSPEAQKHIFDVFTQADNSTTRRFGGTGLGLAISRQLAELMGGNMDLVSVPEQGSEFWFTVKFQLSASSSEGFAARDNFKNTRILIVDDNATNRKILEKQLLAWGIAHDSCVDGNSALVKIQDEESKNLHYDLILLDMMMPGIDGVEVATRLSGKARRPKIILLSSSIDSAGREAAEQNIIDIFMLKPARSSVLYNSISTLLGENNVIQLSTSRVNHQEDYVYPGAKVLIVEDNHINQKVIIGRLNKLSINLDVVNDGKEAVEAVAKNNYDLIFMDCHMPVMDGYEATRLIRQNEGYDHHVTIVAMTANAMEGDRDICIDAGMDDYISKPIKSDVLNGCLQVWLNKFKVDNKA